MGIPFIVPESEFRTMSECLSPRSKILWEFGIVFDSPLPLVKVVKVSDPIAAPARFRSVSCVVMFSPDCVSRMIIHSCPQPSLYDMLGY